MAKVNNKTKGFNSIARELVFDNDLSDRAKFIYVYMSCKPDGWEFYQDTMAKELGYGKDTLRKYLDELICAGWITEEEQQREGGKFGALQYTIEISKKRNGKSPIRETTDSEKYRNGKIPNQKDIDNILSEHSSSNNRDIEKEKRLSKDNPKKDGKFSRFVKPTIDEVEAYIQEKGYHFDAERFMNHYESVGWMIGKNHMRDWKASCRTWECRYKSEHKEEKEEIADIPADDTIAWERCQLWMNEKTPRIAKSITYEMFASMRGMVHFKSCLYAEIIREIEASGFDGDIVAEFERISQTDKYSSRIWQ